MLRLLHHLRTIMKTYKVVDLETNETFIWTIQKVLEEVNRDSLTKEDLLEDPHHPDCPAFDGFGCRCQEIERENHESI